MKPRMGSPLSAIMRAVSMKTTNSSSATTSVLPSCVMVMPVGPASTGNTFFRVICPRARLRRAGPLNGPGWQLLSETKSQQPSGVETVPNGWPGSCTYETGSPAGSLQRDDGPCARADADRHSATSAARASSDVLERLISAEKLNVNLERAAARRAQVNQLPVVFERALAVNDEVRVPLAQGEGRRVPGAAEVGVREPALDLESDHFINVRRFQPVRRRDADDGLRRGERREDLHRVAVARHELELEGARVCGRARDAGHAHADVHVHGAAAVEQHAEGRERLARHLLDGQADDVHCSLPAVNCSRKSRSSSRCPRSCSHISAARPASVISPAPSRMPRRLSCSPVAALSKERLRARACEKAARPSSKPCSL